MGFFDAIFLTGINVEINATAKDTRRSKPICLTPKERIVIRIPISSLKIELIIAETTPVVTIARKKFIIAIINASAKKILNTSLEREPIARRIPISCFLREILVAIKLESIRDANTARARPT